MPSTTVLWSTLIAASSSLPLHRGRGTQADESFAELWLGDVMAPHHDRVLGVLVVALANASRHEAEPAVERLCPDVGDADLQRHRLAPAIDGHPRELGEQACGHTSALAVRGDGDVGDVGVADHEHQPGIASDLHTGAGDDVVALLAAGQLDLAEEDAASPRLGIRDLFDRE